MPPEAQSPSASSVLLPFLGQRSRRNSLASVASRKEIDRDALQQALDDIHTAASKTETFTSFHELDSGIRASGNGAKDQVVGGVSGLYNRLKRSVGGASPSKDGKERPSSRASRESFASGALPPGSPSELLRTSAAGGFGGTASQDVRSGSLTGSATSVAPSTLAASLQRLSERPAPPSPEIIPISVEQQNQDMSGTALVAKPGDNSLPQQDGGHEEEPITVQQIDLARNALLDGDRSESATQALARVLSNDKAFISELRQPMRMPLLNGSENDTDSTFASPSVLVSRTDMSPAHPQELKSLDEHKTQASDAVRTSRELQRPSMPRVGASSLPGFQSYGASSTIGGSDTASMETTRSRPDKPTLEPSPNINSSLGRARESAHNTRLPPSQVPPHGTTHLNRKVMDKEFWMKDENAKECFHCGQPFSTFRRKHHCRTCGQIFDARCTVLVPGRPFGQSSQLRLCKPCEAMVNGSDDDSTIFTDDGEDLGRSPVANRASFGSMDLPTNFDDFQQSQPSVSEVTTPSIGIPASRRNREAKRRSAVIEFDAHPMLARPSSARSLISLSGRPRSSSHRRHQARHHAPRNVRLSVDERVPFRQEPSTGPEKKGQLPVFHNDNIIDPDLAPFLSDEGSDEDDTPNILSAFNPDPSSASADRERFGLSNLLASAVRKGKSRLGDKSSSKGQKDDDMLPISMKNASKMNRKRNPSIGSLSSVRPSPRRSKSNMLLRPLELDSGDNHPAIVMPVSTPSGTRAICSSAMKGTNAPTVEMNQASLDHVRRMLCQLLQDAKIPHVSTWQKALMPVLLRCADDVDPKVQRGDDMDIRHYVKLKKVPGGRPGDTSYVSGIVFSKNIALKSMKRHINNPRIAIVTFAIEYARHQSHFMSLEPILSQEKEYLQNIVRLITALNPHVLLVQRNVSGYALRLLEQAGITVAYNIKASVLAAVARVTQATIIASVDKLNSTHSSRLGSCESFDVKAYMNQDIRRSYVYLSGCQPDLGCTIILRGADTKCLRKVKRIAEFMCYVAYNLRLETCLMRDQFVAVPSRAHEQLAAHDAPEPGLSASLQETDASKTQVSLAKDGSPSPVTGNPPIMTTTNGIVGLDISKQVDDPPSKYAEMEEECRSRVLSASPFVVFMQPYLLTQLREQENKLSNLRKLRDQYAAADEEGNSDDRNDDDSFGLVRPEMVGAPASKDQAKSVREYLHAVYQAQHDRTLQSYENSKRLWEAFLAGGPNPFDPFGHQSIVVLQSLVSSITSAPCDGPSLLGISFYAGFATGEGSSEEDCTLGQFVEDVCETAYDDCTDCNRKLFEHNRQYVHGYGQLSISVQRQPARIRGLEHTILMWSKCRVCDRETTIMSMSENTWKYSFAKYLELSFWSSRLHPRAGVCQHDIHRDFLRCFGYKSLSIMVQYDPIDIYDIVVPRPTVFWKVESDLTVKNDQYTKFETRLHTFIDSVKKRLDSIHVDTLDDKTSVAAHEKLSELHQLAEDDRRELLTKLQQKYSSSRYYELIPLNRALRLMDEKAIAWDVAFNNFERDYFPSETDIRKLATLQLKKMFLDAHPLDNSDVEDGTETSPVDRVMSEKADDQLQSEKAEAAMHSVVEEHKAGQDEAVDQDLQEKKDPTVEGDLSRQISPQEVQEQAVQSENVKHLDLAVAKSPDEASVEERRLSPVSSKELTKTTPRGPSGSAEPFAVPPKPLASGLLERIEQIRNMKSFGGQELESLPESKIPRLADLKKRGPSPHPSRPTIGERTRSTPGQITRNSTDAADDHTNMDLGDSMDSSALDRRLLDRVSSGLSATRVGRAVPSLIPRSIPLRPDSVTNSVSALAKHFEQMSREFEKERLKERRQRAARSRQARANPLASSRPVVEVYRDAHEAVDEISIEPGSGERRSESVSKRSIRSPFARAMTEPQLPSSDDILEPLRLEDASAKENNETDSQQHKISDIEGEGDDSDLDRSGDLANSSKDDTEPNSEVPSTLLSPSTVPDLDPLQPELAISDQKKNVWFKYLADFWSKRSASGWANLEYPLRSTEHVFEDSDIIVREDEPSSAIALALACNDYANKVKEFRSHPNKHGHKHEHSSSQTSNSFVAEDEQQKAIEASLLSNTGTHMKYSFSHGQVKVQCKIFYAESFDALRRRCDVADRFVESLSRCFKYDSKGGKTKSLFLKTLDNRFIVKSLQEVELKAFTKFAPDYFAFMSYTLFHGVPSVIAKMFGLYQVFIRNPATGMDFSYYLLVMENLFYERNPNRRFDLKGSMRNRKIESTGQPDEVLLDENLVETIFEKPLFVREHARKLLQASVWNDTMWLCKQNVMDYSLMAGFDDESKELVVGIIDCIRTYTWDKKLESWIKDRGKNRPTITSPKDYRNRFRVSMMQYALQAPNCWHQFQAQMAPPKRLRERDDGEETGTEGERSQLRRSEGW